MMASDIEVNLLTKCASDSGWLHSNVLLGDWIAERVSTVRFVWCIFLSKERAIGHSRLV